MENPTTPTSEPDVVVKAREEREKLRIENERLEKNLKELKELEAHKALAGDAGGHVVATPKVETDREYRLRIQKEINEGKYNGKKDNYS